MRHAYEQGSSSHTEAQRTAGADRKGRGPSRSSWTEREFAEKNHAKHWEQGDDADLELERQGRSVAWIPDDRFPDDRVSEGGDRTGDVAENRGSRATGLPSVGRTAGRVRSVSWSGRDGRHDGGSTKAKPVRGKAAKTRAVKAASVKAKPAKATPTKKKSPKAQSAALPVERKGTPTKNTSAKGKDAKRKSAKGKAGKKNSTKGKSVKGKNANEKALKTEAEQAQRSGWKTAPATGRPFDSGRTGADPFKGDVGSLDSGIPLPLRSNPEEILPLADDPVGTGDSSSILPPADDPMDVGDTGSESNLGLPLPDEPAGSGTAVPGSAPLDSWRPDHVESEPASNQASAPEPAVEPRRTFGPESASGSVPAFESGPPPVSRHEYKPLDGSDLQGPSESATKATVQSVAQSAAAFQPTTKPSTTVGPQTKTGAKDDEAGARAGIESGNVAGEPEKASDESKKGGGKPKSGRRPHRSKPKRSRFAFGARGAAARAGHGNGGFSGEADITSPRKVVGESGTAAEPDKVDGSDRIVQPGWMGEPDKTTESGKPAVSDVAGKSTDAGGTHGARPRVTVNEAVNAVVGQSAFAFVYLAITIMVVILGDSVVVTYLRGKISDQAQSFLLGGGLYLLSCLVALVYVFFSERRTLTGHELHGDDQVRWITGRGIRLWPLILALALLLVGQALADGLNLCLQALVPMFHISPAILMSPLTSLSGSSPMQAYALLVLPLTEEIIFRGVIMNGLRRFGRVFAIVTSAFLCAFMQGQPTQMIWAFLVGLVLGALAMEYGLVWSIGAHILASVGYSGLVVPWLSRAPVQVRGVVALVAGLVVLAGLVILIRKFSSLLAYARRYRAPKGIYASWRQSWFVLYCLCSLAVAVLQYL